MTTPTATNGTIGYSNPVALASLPEHIFFGKHIEYTNYSNAAIRQGWVVRKAPVEDPDYSNHYIVITEDGYTQFIPVETAMVQAIHSLEDKPLSHLHSQLAFAQWEKRNLYTAYTKANQMVAQKDTELREWDNKVRKACEEADERGYCSEFERIAEAAGFDIPEMEEHDVSCTVTITVTISKEARTLEKAKQLVTYDDISAAISGEDSIDDWNVD